jgi:hypothetical protein
MAGRRDKRLTREGEPSQKTEKGLEVPVLKPLGLTQEPSQQRAS